jgi:hypothetical protein
MRGNINDAETTLHEDLGAKIAVRAVAVWQAGRYRGRPLNPQALMPQKAKRFPQTEAWTNSRIKIIGFANDLGHNS